MQNASGPQRVGSRAPHSRRRRKVVVAIAVVALLVVLDGLRPPQRQVGVALALLAIDGYQITVSRVLGRLGARCRFEPSCSHYGELAIRNRGLVPGSWLVVRRILRCGPWTPAGTIDAPPGPREVRAAGAGG